MNPSPVTWRRREGVAAIAAELAARRVDVLLNLAGVQYFGPFERQDPQSAWLGFAVNLIAPVLLSQAVLPQMRARNAGQIVNIGSVFGAIPFAHFVTYSSAKGGMRAFSDALRRELAGSGGPGHAHRAARRSHRAQQPEGPGIRGPDAHEHGRPGACG